MKREPFIAPLLWIIPGDQIRGIEAKDLAVLLRDKAGCDAWSISDDAVAYSFRDVLVDRGFALNYDKQLEKTQFVRRLLSEVVPADRDATEIELPDHKYWAIMSLRPGESELRECCYFKNRLENYGAFGFKATAPYRLRRQTKDKLRIFLEEWIAKASNEDTNGEFLQLGEVSIASYSQLGNPKSYPQDGFYVTCASYLPSTWPWIDLYLTMRKRLPPKERLSLEFSHPAVQGKGKGVGPIIMT